MEFWGKVFEAAFEDHGFEHPNLKEIACFEVMPEGLTPNWTCWLWRRSNIQNLLNIMVKNSFEGL